VLLKKQFCDFQYAHFTYGLASGFWPDEDDVCGKK
jgi:hypothetical protein